jgi:nicotinamide riboside transporter PnuC
MTADINAEMIAKLGPDALARLAGIYVWWKTAVEVAADPQQLIPRIMDRGDWDDVMLVENTLGNLPFRRAIESAEAGQFTARSWHFWHYRLGLAKVDQVPPLPARRISDDEVATFNG